MLKDITCHRWLFRIKHIYLFKDIILLCCYKSAAPVQFHLLFRMLVSDVILTILLMPDVIWIIINVIRCWARDEIGFFIESLQTSQVRLQQTIISFVSFICRIHAKNELPCIYRVHFSRSRWGYQSDWSLSIWCHFIWDLENFQSFNLCAYNATFMHDYIYSSFLILKDLSNFDYESNICSAGKITYQWK